MFGLSFFEILFLAALALIVIGPKQLPEVARTIGRFVNELRRTTSTLTTEMKQSMRQEEMKSKTSSATTVAPTEKKDPDHV